ncbi:MAG: pyridoxal-phosphate dependent enzyme [Nitrososphaerales archaeon]
MDRPLLDRFAREVKSRVPHLDAEGASIVNATPLVDMTDELIECAESEYGLNLSGRHLRVYGKLESKTVGGSVKVRPAVQIVEDAIRSGRLRERTTVFEATSGNFGIALGLMRRLDLDVVALVSRKLQGGVLKELERSGVKTLNLDVDICPAPGLKADPRALVAKAVASSVREQLSQYGFNASVFEDAREEIETLLAGGDAIGLAKLLARIYHGFCPEQYDNELNARAHETLTGPEIEQQLADRGGSLSRFDLVCAFGTGGTSAGLSRYVQDRFGRKAVHVVFPLADQDVAGIRTREKALGLKFYEPKSYAGEHEADFAAARPALAFFVRKGYDIGESSALVLYAILQMVGRGAGERFVAILADGSQKYVENRARPEAGENLEVTLQEARSGQADFGGVVWTHPVFLPSGEGVELLASSLGRDTDEIRVAEAGDVESLYLRREITEGLGKLLPNDGRRLLLVCMNGSTSLRIAQLLSEQGVGVASLKGGMAALSTHQRERASELIQLAPG